MVNDDVLFPNEMIFSLALSRCNGVIAMTSEPRMIGTFIECCFGIQFDLQLAVR